MCIYEARGDPPSMGPTINIIISLHITTFVCLLSLEKQKQTIINGIETPYLQILFSLFVQLLLHKIFNHSHYNSHPFFLYLLLHSFPQPFLNANESQFNGDLRDAKFPWNKLCFDPPFEKLKLAVFSKTWPVGA